MFITNALAQSTTATKEAGNTGLGDVLASFLHCVQVSYMSQPPLFPVNIAPKRRYGFHNENIMSK